MLLGIMGKMGAGKDTVADVLVRDHGFVKLGLADPLKRICREVYDFSEEQLWGPSEKRNAPDPRYFRGPDGFLSPRFALQRLGTEWGRECYRDTWVDYALRTAKAIQRGQRYDQIRGLVPEGDKVGRSVVIPDCRFRNEFDAIRAVGGKMIRIMRPGLLESGHVSETEQETISGGEFDHVILNNGTIDELELDVLEWLRVQG